MSTAIGEFNPPDRLLLGPGPSNVDPRVMAAMGRTVISHTDPECFRMLDEIRLLLQYAFQTANNLTLLISGTGTAGMEAAVYNAIEPGDRVLVCVAGYFSDRICQMVQRCGGEPIRLDTEWGQAVDPEQVEAALQKSKVKLLALVHAETSTGILQPLEEISRLVHNHGALLLVDAVTSLGGCPLKVDEWQLDMVYSCSQKCLSCSPGLAPLTFSTAAERALDTRKDPAASWYLDLAMIRRYWGQEHAYHHTVPISLYYAMREALRLVQAEGIEARWQRHQHNHRALMAGLEAMGLLPFAQAGYRLPSLNTVRVPEGISDAKVRGRLLQDYGIEIGGGLGKVKGQIWRIGLMGYNSTRRTVLTFLTALEAVLRAEGYALSAGAAWAAAEAVYSAAR
jgi:alanine-glyoxylate transaminase/serine-glyoxylate transaminase/serine-pyruvate transaminase